MSETCPHCGYCQHCGQAQRPRYLPWSPPYRSPYYGGEVYPYTYTTFAGSTTTTAQCESTEST